MNTLMYDLFNEIFKTGNWGVTAVNLIISNVALFGNYSKASGYCSIDEFIILKHFNIKVHPP